ncbi:hypothetical protein [Micromonospora sp. 4G55]|uniref:hypothetical protein n=1 Tax=Micromonospora sp. 4G55 TaxID=2806102 RepID=UPI001A62B2B5|nr:hypothetical protein [Micromonospora sp. 4G55]MBM0258453.1 hypothetical protein [Micromonospora sp. 4G55]
MNASAASTTGTELALAPVEAASSRTASTQAPRPTGGTVLPRARPTISASTAISGSSSTQLYVIDGLPQTMKVTWLPKSCRSPFSKPNSPTVNISPAATTPAYGRPVTRQPTTATSTAASAQSAGTASRKKTVGRSTPLTRLAAARWAKPNQW